MNIFKVIGFALIAVSLIMILKNQRPEIALMCVIASSIIMLVFVFDEIKSVVVLLNNLIETSSINKSLLIIVLKVIGISYVVEFGRNICIDAGENSIASKIEMAGKVIIVSLSIPIITSLVEMVAVIIWKKLEEYYFV